jgi:hypothetical protein
LIAQHMVTRQVSLLVSSFLDSDEARALRGVTRDELQRVATAFLELCYDAAGKEPRYIDAEDLRSIVGVHLPGKFARKDPIAERVPDVLEAFVKHTAATGAMSNAFEVQLALPEVSGRFVELVKHGRNTPQADAKTDPFVHGASKTGRNDPCPCGSGKKFKKCHGTDA